MKARMPAGYGRPDMNALMRQAQKMQEDMKSKQAELEAAEYTGSAAGGCCHQRHREAGGRDCRSRDGQADRRPEHSGSLSREGEIPWTTLPHRWKS